MPLPKANILVVDDEPSVLLTVAAILRYEGYAVDTAETGECAIQIIRDRGFDVVLTDLKMEPVDGLAVLAEVQKRSPNTVTIMMTGYGSVDSAVEAVQLGAYEYLLKPVEVHQLKLAVQRSLDRKRLCEIDTLYRVSGDVARAHDPDTISEIVCNAATQVLNIASAELISFDGSDVDVGEDADSQLRSQFADTQARLDAAGTLEKLCAGEIIVCNQESANVRSMVLVPGRSSDRLICVLVGNNGPEQYDFHASAQRFLQGLANQAALALENTALVAELRQHNSTLADANRKLAELDQLKSQFLSVATHELRTPLSVILGYNSMLADTLDDRLSQDERETLHESIASCKRLIRLVNSMLDISQIEAGKMRMSFAPSDLRQVVQSVCALFQHEARSTGLTLHVVVPSRLPKITIDAERIEQVLINLLGNALKFTDAPGSITVAVRHLVGERSIQVSVSDTGIGIASDEQAAIFDDFAQIRRQGQRPQTYGSGLGLAVAKRIVTAHDGNIWVTSTPGQGSTFTFVLPLRHPETSAVSA